MDTGTILRELNLTLAPILKDTPTLTALDVLTEITTAHPSKMMHSRTSQRSGKTSMGTDLETIQTEPNQIIVQLFLEPLTLTSMDARMRTMMEPVTPMTCGPMIHLNGSIQMVTVGVITSKAPMETPVLPYLELRPLEMPQDVSILMQMAMLIPMIVSRMNQLNGPIVMAMDLVIINHQGHQEWTTGSMTRLVTLLRLN